MNDISIGVPLFTHGSVHNTSVGGINSTHLERHENCKKLILMKMKRCSIYGNKLKRKLSSSKVHAAH